MADFNFVPNYGMSKSTQPRVNVAKFGDGYEQRTPNGINTMLSKYDLKFELSDAELSTVITFLESKGGATAFTWVPPGESQILVVCREWSVSYEGYGYNLLNTTFEEVLA